MWRLFSLLIGSDWHCWQSISWFSWRWSRYRWQQWHAMVRPGIGWVSLLGSLPDLVLLLPVAFATFVDDCYGSWAIAPAPLAKSVGGR